MPTPCAEPCLALKLDVDTLRGYREGVPRLLNLLGRHGLSASIFFSFGPDNSGKAIRRIFRPGFLTKMWRTKAPMTYGFKTLLYGTLLPAPLIVPGDPSALARAVAAGHDCGVHAWDHVFLQDRQENVTTDLFKEHFSWCAHIFNNIAGRMPDTFAAPGWQVGRAALDAADELRLAFTSSTRGIGPYYPVIGDCVSKTLELPTTLATMDEMYGLDGADDASIPGLWMAALKPGYNALTFHAEMEGLSKLPVFERFLSMAREAGVRLMTLRTAAHLFGSAAVPVRLVQGMLPGRAGTLALQKGTV